MTFTEWCIHHGMDPGDEDHVAVWNGALEQAKKNITAYGEPYAKSSLKVALAVEGCSNVCDRLVHKN